MVHFLFMNVIPYIQPTPHTPNKKPFGNNPPFSLRNLPLSADKGGLQICH